jgi:hypothetical protein
MFNKIKIFLAHQKVLLLITFIVLILFILVLFTDDYIGSFFLFCYLFFYKMALLPLSYTALLPLVLKSFSLLVGLLIAIAIFTLVERKGLGMYQRRTGPNVHGIFGLLQPGSDGIKLFVKEQVIPSNSNKIIFKFIPALFLATCFFG